MLMISHEWDIQVKKKKAVKQHIKEVDGKSVDFQNQSTVADH